MSKFEHGQLGELLNRAYELEGLLLLAISRQDSDKNIQKLILSKIFGMADSAAEWDPTGLEEYRESCVSPSIPDTDDCSYAYEESEETETAEESEQPEESLLAEKSASGASEQEPDFELEVIDEDDECAEDFPQPAASESEPEREDCKQSDECGECEPQSEQLDEPLMASVVELQEAPLQECSSAEASQARIDPIEIERDEEVREDMADVSIGPMKECTPLDYDLPAKEAQNVIMAEAVAARPAPQPQQAAQERRKPVEGPMPRPVFSLNDRYMFTRTLFHNSKKEFDDAVRYISGLESYDEAEDYFINELEWDLSDQDVKLFSDVIHRYFNAL